MGGLQGNGLLIGLPRRGEIAAKLAAGSQVEMEVCLPLGARTRRRPVRQSRTGSGEAGQGPLVFPRVTEYRTQGVPDTGTPGPAGQRLLRRQQRLPVTAQGNQDFARLGVVVGLPRCQRRCPLDYLQGLFPLAIVGGNHPAEEPGIGMPRIRAQDVQAQRVGLPQVAPVQCGLGCALALRGSGSCVQKRYTSRRPVCRGRFTFL